MLIEECLDDSDGIEILEKNPQTNSMCPFMFAAAGDTNELDLLYYLVVITQLLLCRENERDDNGQNLLWENSSNLDNLR